VASTGSRNNEHVMIARTDSPISTFGGSVFHSGSNGPVSTGGAVSSPGGLDVGLSVSVSVSTTCSGGTDESPPASGAPAQLHRRIHIMTCRLSRGDVHC
jgi:hypothetical protein